MESLSFRFDEALLFIILAPLLGAIVTGLFGRYLEKWLVSAIAVGSVAFSFVLSLVAFAKVHAAGAEGRIVYQFYEWFSIAHPGARGGVVPVNFRLAMDSLSGIMCLMVTGIAALIHLYSVGYMSEEKSYSRFFSYLNLFTASMLVLVLASNLPLMFVGWEGVGLCSYLLIGFWYENRSYAAAGRKAFVANRIGDFGVLIGMFILVAQLGSFEFADINENSYRLLAPAFDGVEITLATLACLFIFLGCTGKSAQIPLYVWLPDAMAGPTPVSALIHAATMVTSGVYLCCRLSPVFMKSPTAMMVIAIIGTLTALLAATIALVQREMKKILAYSTVSQLGFMFAAVGVGAFGAGIFHVFTHAFFKACLFLGAGSVMHAVGAHGDADIFKLGGLKKHLPKTSATFLVACLAIAGIPGFAGFFSKDEILLGASLLANAGEEAFAAPWVGWFVLISLVVAATLTAFYMFRLYFLTFTGSYRSAEGAEHAHGHDDHGHGHGYDAHPHESPWTMTVPLIVLAAGSVLAGLLGLPHAFHLPNWWGHWLEVAVAHVPGFGPSDHVENMTPVYLAMGLGTAAALVGSLGALSLYRDAEKDRVTETLPGALYRFLFDKWRVDELYEATVLGPIRRLGVVVGRVDQTFVDALLTKATSAAVQGFGWVTTRAQVGVVHAYALVMVIGVAGMSYWFLYPHPNLEVEVAPDGSATLSVARGLGYRYRWDKDGDGEPEVAEWSTDPTPPSVSFTPEQYVGVRLVIHTPVHAEDQVFEIGDEPLLLTDSILGAGWEGTAESRMPPAVTYDRETKEIVIKPNLYRILPSGEEMEAPEIRLAPGRRQHLGLAQVAAAPVVRTGVEVQNAFGNVVRDEIEIELTSARPQRGPAGHGAGNAHMPGALGARLEALRNAAAAGHAPAQAAAAAHAPADRGTP